MVWRVSSVLSRGCIAIVSVGMRDYLYRGTSNSPAFNEIFERLSPFDSGIRLVLQLGY